MKPGILALAEAKDFVQDHSGVGYTFLIVGSFKAIPMEFLMVKKPANLVQITRVREVRELEHFVPS
jgi:hypothetical protein